MNNFITLEDQNYQVNLEVLSTVAYVPPIFRPLGDFLITELIYQGDASSIFRGKLDETPVIIETCTRIPFRLVCKEIKMIKELKISNVVKIKACTRNPSLGIISIAYEPIEFQKWPLPIPTNCLLPLFQNIFSNC